MRREIHEKLPNRELFGPSRGSLCMMSDTLTPPSAEPQHRAAPEPLWRRLVGRITRLEMLVGAALAALLLVLVVIEPDILEAPFENSNTILFTLGGTAIAAVAFIAMLWLRVPAPVRIVVLVVPFALVNWWLLSPYFIDDVVDEGFSTSISAQLAEADAPAAAPAAETDAAVEAEPGAPADAADGAAPAEEPAAEDDSAGAAPAEPVAEGPPPAPAGPVLLGAGQFIGLAGHDGTGDAGIFENPDGSFTLRFENFDIDNGPDLEVYLVPGADQTDLAPGSIHLGALSGNVGNQNYELPEGTELAPGTYTVLVWCEAFSVEFVGATITV